MAIAAKFESRRRPECARRSSAAPIAGRIVRPAKAGQAEPSYYGCSCGAELISIGGAGVPWV